MTVAAHVVPVDRARQMLVGAALGVVGASVVLFTALGAAGLGASDVVAADAVVDESAPSSSEEPEGDPAAPVGGVTEAGDDEGADEPAAEAPATEDPAADDPVAEEPVPTEFTVEPASVSVQVLDGDGDPSSAALTDAVAADLVETGYDVVVVNPAVRQYAVTTVFWTGDNEDAARELAARFGFEDVAPSPDNLSDSVTVHVVVGADAG